MEVDRADGSEREQRDHAEGDAARQPPQRQPDADQHQGDRDDEEAVGADREELVGREESAEVAGPGIERDVGVDDHREPGRELLEDAEDGDGEQHQ